MRELTKEEIANGHTPESLQREIEAAERRTADRVFSVFDRRPPLRIERTRSAHDWTRKGSAYNWWRRDLKGEVKRGD